MRIAIDGRFIQDHFPGIARYTFNLIRHLPAVSDDHFVVFHNPALPNTRYRLRELSLSGRVELVPVAAPSVSFIEQWRLPLAAQRWHVDLLHSPYYVKPYVPSVPSVTTVYDAISDRYPEYLPSRRARLLYRWSMHLALATSRRVLTLSEWSRRDLVRFYRVPPERVSVTLLAADPRYRPLEPAKCRWLAERYGLPGRFALYVGINKPHKNLVTLVEAAALARKESDVRLVIAGAHDHRWPLAKEAVVRHGLDDAIRFLPDVPEDAMVALYNLAEYFVFPSLSEGFGLPPLEAMACGIPVICANSSSLPEVVGDAALLCDPLDVRSWAAAMGDLWESPARRADLAERGLIRAAQFSWENTARETVQAYREALRE